MSRPPPVILSKAKNLLLWSRLNSAENLTRRLGFFLLGLDRFVDAVGFFFEVVPFFKIGAGSASFAYLFIFANTAFT